ncbi:hypothetical protein BaRGS_00036939, partial [Batillaria attramentaria]
ITGPGFEPDPLLIRAGQELNKAIDEMMAPSTDTVLSSVPFVRFIPGTYYAQLCTRYATHKRVVIHELFDKLKVQICVLSCL